ncbi:potassium channel family protein [Cryomorphaceae bacterium 1068]|nr:potassium channel family protein [Cryomorphaceae bacterium 1068]
MLTSFKYLKELYFALAIIFGIIVLGVVGFMFIEDYSFSEALYMTVITVSTVGFKEVRQLTDTGRFFTIFLILVSFGTFAFTVSSVSKYIITGTFQRYYKKYKMDSRINNLEGHVVLCGAGRNGIEALENLIAHNQEVVVIDKKEDIANELNDKGLLYIEGDATEEEILVNAGIDKASALITALPKDTDNVFVVLSARELNKNMRIVSRCTLDSSDSKLKIAGANVVIMPDKVGGARMAGFIINHNVNRFIDTVSLRDGGDAYLTEYKLSELPCKTDVKTIGGILEALNTKCKVVGTMSADFEYVMNPPDSFEVPSKSQVFFFGKPDEIAAIKEKMSS